jgi:hypothetical protein
MGFYQWTIRHSLPKALTALRLDCNGGGGGGFEPQMVFGKRLTVCHLRATGVPTLLNGRELEKAKTTVALYFILMPVDSFHH